MGIKNNRIDALRTLLARKGLDAAAFNPGPTFRYLTGGVFHVSERPTVLIVPADGRAPAIVIPSLELGSWRVLDIEAEVFSWTDEKGYGEAFDVALRHLGVKSLGIEAQALRYLEFSALKSVSPDLAITDIQAELVDMRSVKDGDEIAAIQKAIDLSEKAWLATIENLRAGMTEAQVQRAFMANMLDAGVTGALKAPMVAAADNSARPHGKVRADYVIKSGDPVLFDFVVIADGYHSDITRTVFVDHVSDRHRRVYDAVLAANELGLAITREGLTAHALDDAVRGALEGGEFGAYTEHKTGHGLGLDVHEAPMVMRGNHAPLRAGQVITIEPGLYLPGDIGVRIEDDVLIEKEGNRCLSALPKHLMIVG